MDKIIDAIITQGGSLWLLLGYITLKDILPKVFPEMTKAISKRVTVEDRLFSVIDRSNASSIDLAKALVRLSDSLEGLDQRVLHIENVIVQDRRSKLIIPASTELARQAHEVLQN